jgi:alginate O-acetyltransferase complex protein AlgJ
MAVSIAVDAPIKRSARAGQEKNISIESVITALAFVGTIFSFGILTAQRFSIPDGTVAALENRTIASFPQLRCSERCLKDFPPGFNAFYNDRLAYRTDLIRALSLLRYRCFDVSASPNVLAGKDGWLYFIDGGDEETLRRVPLFSDQDLTQWKRMLEERRSWCEARHIRFLFVIAPTKSTIYREFVPPQYTALSAETRADQLLYYLKAHSKVETLDLRKPVFAAKRLGQVFFKTDTHWNRVGGFIGYEAVMNRLKQWFPALKPLKLKDMVAHWEGPFQGDLANMIGIEHQLPEMFIELKPPRGFNWHLAASPPPHDIEAARFCFEPFATENDTCKSPRVFFIRDSFWVMPQEMFSQSFSRAYFYWKRFYDFPAQTIEHEAPDVLVQEMVERHLSRPVPINPPELSKYWTERSETRSNRHDATLVVSTSQVKK